VVTDAIAILRDGFGRIQEEVGAAVAGLDEAALTARIAPGANTIGWLVWHLTRVQDDHVAGVAGTEQVWTAQGFVNRFGLPFRPGEHGYGHGTDQVAEVRNVPADLFVEYHDAVHAATTRYLAGLSADDLDRVVDSNWDPPVTAAVRLVSVLSDDLQHVGQAAYVRGIVTSGG
jgi:hypothetical protein